MKNFILYIFLLLFPSTIIQAQVQLYAPKKDSLNAPTSIELAWIHQNNALNYKIEIDTTPNFNTVRCRKIVYTGVVNQLTPGMITTQLFRNLLHNTPYFWRVQMMTNADTTFSEVRSFTTTNEVKIISPLANASGVAVNEYFIYEARFNTMTYHYQVGTSTSTILTNPLYDDVVLSYAPYGIDYSTESFTLPASLNTFTDYYWRMREENDSSVSAWTEIMKFTTIDESFKTSISNEKFNIDQILYPNPASDQVHYALNFTPTKITIYDSKGLCVETLAGTNNKGIISTEKFARGFYTLQFTSSSGEQLMSRLILCN